MNPSAPPTNPNVTPEGIGWLGADAIVARTIGLAAENNLGEQAELALEASSPFPAEQLYYGFVPAEDHSAMAIFASHRRSVDLSTWADNKTVLPVTVALLGSPPANPCIRCWTNGQVTVAAAWTRSQRLPDCWLVRKAGTDQEAGLLLAEAHRRLGTIELAVEEYAGPLRSSWERKGQVLLVEIDAMRSGPGLATRLSRQELAGLDMRDKSFLSEREKANKAGRYIMAAAATGVIVLLVAALGELALMNLRQRIGRGREEIAALSPEVRRIETAQQLSTRIDQLSTKRLQPFELLNIVNDVRPSDIEFTRCEANTLNQLTIDALARNTASIGSYESALRQLASVAGVNLKMGTLRDGVANFQVEVTFKPDALKPKRNGV